MLHCLVRMVAGTENLRFVFGSVSVIVTTVPCKCKLTVPQNSKASSIEARVECIEYRVE